MNHLRSAWTETSLPCGALLVALLGLAPGVNCRAQPAPAPARVPTSASPTPTAPLATLLPPWQLRQPVQQVRLYVDLSASMQGYVRTPGSPLHTLLREIDAGLFEQDVADSQLMALGFGGSLDAPKAVGGLTDVLGWKATKSESCLVLPLQIEAARTDAALVLVVTDGVADSGASACGQSCAAGSDTTCVAEAVYAYLARGHGLWVVGLRAPFSGKYFSAQSGAALPVARAGRPIYLWIGSPNVATGRALVRRATAKLAQALGSARANDLLALEVWPGAWRGIGAPAQRGEDSFKVGEFSPGTAASTLQCGSDTVGIDAIAKDNGWPALTLRHRGHAPMPTDGVWGLRLPLAGQPDATPPPGHALLTLEARRRGADLDVRGHGLRIVRSRAAGPAAVLLCLRLQAPTGRLTSSWSPSIGTEFLTAWSTDDDTNAAMISRTLGIEALWTQVAERLEREARRLDTTLLSFETRGVRDPRDRR